MVVSKNIRAVEGLTLDYVSKNLFYTDESYGVIGVIRLKSQGFSDRRNIIDGLGKPRAIVTHPSVG